MTFLRGGKENDLIHGTIMGDLILAFRGDDTIEAGDGHDIVFAGRGNDLIYGMDGNDLLVGGAGDDTLVGGDGADILIGGSGDDLGVFNLSQNLGQLVADDYYDGGEGFDVLRIELTGDQWSDEGVRAEIRAFLDYLRAVEDGNAVMETYHLELLGLTVVNVEAVDLTVDGFSVDPYSDQVVVDRSGSTEDEVIQVTGETDADITTGSGNDTVLSGGGNDTISTGDGDDFIESGAGSDIIAIGNGHDVVRAGSGNDTIVAGQGLGDDIIDGGSGQDWVKYPSVNDGAVNIDLRPENRELTQTSAKGTIGEYLVSYGYSATLPVGIATGAVVLEGDTDEIDVDILIDIENAEGGGGNDTIHGNDLANYLIGAGGNDTIIGYAAGDEIEGGLGNDWLLGGEGDDVMSGGGDNDTMVGGNGYDSLILSGNLADYEFSSNNDGTVTVTDIGGNGDGVDIISSIEVIVANDTTVGLWTQIGFLEYLGTSVGETITGSPGRDRIIGFGGDDTLLGGAAEDILTGGSGNDVLDGGSGTDDDANFVWDIVDYSREQSQGGTQGVFVDLDTGYAIDTFGDVDTLIEIERIFTTQFDDTIYGSVGTDAFDDFGGNDSYHGGEGKDYLMYHLVSDWDGAGGVIVVYDAQVEGSGTVVIDPFGGTDTFTGIEVFRATFHDDVITAGAGWQEIRTYSGDDIVDGAIGTQLVSYFQDASYGGFAGVSVDLSATDASGFATAVDGFGDIDQLRGIEQIRGTGAEDYIRGNALDNFLRGDAGDDALYGEEGSDTLHGGRDDDLIEGGTGDDVLRGETGMDTLEGGVGSDELTGGYHGDEFVFHSGDASSGDTITDFALGEDTLVLLDGLTITALTEGEFGGEAGLDTRVDLSDGGQVLLWEVSGITDHPEYLLS